ncbi:MAG: BamA/TamA family outer membrane protein [Gemmatimonadaceae bacterium]
MTRSWLVGAGLTVAVNGICTSAAAGQGRPPAAGACNGEMVSRIDIETLPPFEPGCPSLTARAAHIATALHATTSENVVRRFLLLHEGDPCSDLQVRESERILRVQPFLANANIVAIPDGQGGVSLNVITSDETSLIADGTFTSKSPVVRALRLGDQNIGGSAIAGVASWRHGTFLRDTYRGSLTDYQFLGRPYQLSLQGSRNEIGGSWDALITHPFFTDLQRRSWRASAGSLSGYLSFNRRGDPHAGPPDAGLPDGGTPHDGMPHNRSHYDAAPDVSLKFSRSYANIGSVAALGPLSRVFLVGGTLSRESERTGATPVQLHESKIAPDTSSVLFRRFGAHQSSRVNLLLGFRHIQFMRVEGFDAVEGAQDVRTGVEVATLLGKGFKLVPEDERDYFVSTDLYAGRGSPASFTAFEVLTERRRNLETHTWDGILATGRAAWYAHAAARHTSIFDVEYSGGWRQRVPFQVRLSDRDGGLRGYRTSDLGGAQRLVTRLEERYQFGHVRQFASVAGALFLDAGKLWAGESPFGVTTGVKLSAGVGLLAGLPPRSRRTWRVDLAMPLNDRGDAAKYEIRFSNRDFTRWFWREPGDVLSSRERSIPNSIFNWQ